MPLPASEPDHILPTHRADDGAALDADAMRLLLVEDNAELAGLLCAQLHGAAFSVDYAGSAADADMLLRTHDYVAVILDLGLPDGNGLDILRRLRAERRPIPVLVLTARGSVADRVRGLDLGADDYLAKPFAFEELKARLFALLRRPGALLGQSLCVADVALDTVSREVRIGAQSLHLPQRETELLELLLRRADRVVPKSIVESQLFGADDELGSNAVEVYVHRLRKRLDQHGAGVAIHTIRGVGYLITATGADP